MKSKKTIRISKDVEKKLYLLTNENILSTAINKITEIAIDLSYENEALKEKINQ